ncbi:hypothetical protein GQ457_18G008030 [Hibiscus cannabinus]
MVSTPLQRGRDDLVVDGVHSTPPMETILGCRWCPLHSTEGDKTWLRNCQGVHSTPPRETRLIVDQSYGDMRAAAIFRVDAIVEVSTPLHRGRQDWVVHQLGWHACRCYLQGRRNCQGVHSTPPRETRLVLDQSYGDMRATAVFRVDAIVEVSTPLHRKRQDWVGVHSTPPRDRTGLYINWGDMRATAVFRVDAIVNVSTPLHRGRQDLVVHQSCGLICFAFPLENKTPSCQGS